MKYKYLITGGAGFIGSEIANLLGSDCIVIDNLTTGKETNLNKQIKLEVGDIRNIQFLENVFKLYRPERIIHLASQIDASLSIVNPNLDAEINILGSINILNMAAKYACKNIILASSAAVYGDNKNLPLKENETLNPLNPYGISKMTIESYAKFFYKNYGLNYVILRFSNVYGAKQNSNAECGAIAIFTNRLMNNNDVTIYGKGKQTRDFIYVKDVANATIIASQNNKVGTYNVSTNEVTSINHLVNIMKDVYKSSSNINHAEKRNGEIMHSCLDNKKIIKDFDWTPLYSLQTGLSDMRSNLKK